jgi:hypothetical protein
MRNTAYRGDPPPNAVSSSPASLYAPAGWHIIGEPFRGNRSTSTSITSSDRSSTKVAVT